MYKKYDARIKAGLMIHTSGGAEVQESRAFDPRKVKSEGTPPPYTPFTWSPWVRQVDEIITVSSAE